jgi:anti-anti-sigma regulatory factor
VIEARPLDAGTLLVVVGGTADREVALGVQRAILHGVQAGRTSAIVDLSEVAEVRPGLLGVLLRIRRRLLSIGGSLTVVSPVPVGTLFGVAAADEVLPRVAARPETG